MKKSSEREVNARSFAVAWEHRYVQRVPMSCFGEGSGTGLRVESNVKRETQKKFINK